MLNISIIMSHIFILPSKITEEKEKLLLYRTFEQINSQFNKKEKTSCALYESRFPARFVPTANCICVSTEYYL